MSNTKLIKSYLIDELDKTLAIVGAIFSLILTVYIKLVIDNFLMLIVGIICFTMCTGYLMIRKFFSHSLISSLDELRCSNRFYITLNILFFLLLSFSILSIYLRTDSYIRPIWYFISTALMATLVANEILFLSPQKPHIYFSLFKIIIIGLSLQYSQILIFSSVVGVDPWWHQWFTNMILDNGHIPEGFAYSKLPIMHLMIGMTSLVTDLGYKMATMVSISSLQVISDALFVFLLGKFLISNKVGLLAALLLEVSNTHLRFGAWTTPNTAGAILILPIIFIFFKVRNNKPFIGTLVAMFLMGTLILTHTISAMVLAIIFYVIWAGSDIYTRLFHEEESIRPVTLILSVLFSIGMLTYWTYVTVYIRYLAYIIKISLRANLLGHSYQYLFNIPFWEQIFNNIGMFLYFSISFIGCLYLLSKQFRNKNRFLFIISGIAIICITFFSLLNGRNIILGRWLYFSQILQAIPLSLSLLLINSMFKNKLIKCLLISISVFALSFFLIMSPEANIDNRFFSPTTEGRYAITEIELTALNTLSETWNGNIASDWYYQIAFKYELNQKTENIENNLFTGDFIELQDTLIVIREHILGHQYKGRKINFIWTYDIHGSLEKQNFSRIYNSGSVSGYLKP